MSGRAYARDAQGFLGGGADLASIVPHTFRIASPKRSLSVRELGIRRVIRRRCMEKNWKKLISRRHVRESQETEAVEADAASEQVCETDSATLSNGAALSEQDAISSSNSDSANDSAAAAASTATSGSSTAKPSAENGTRKPKTETAPDSETVALAKRQLEELEAKLQTLVDEKHAKFVQLKSILVEEARSKSSTPTPADTATAAAVAKKRRVEFKDSAATAASLADAAAAPGSPAPIGGTTPASGPSAAAAGSAAPVSSATPSE